jgi:transporter family protein
MQSWIWLATIALVFFGITGVTQKLSTNNISFELSFLWFCMAFFVIAGAIAATMHLDWHVSLSTVAFAAMGGLLNGLGALTSFAAFKKGGKASVVTPLINLYPLVTVAGAWLLLGERLTWTQVAGIFAALISVVLLSQEGEAGTK